MSATTKTTAACKGCGIPLSAGYVRAAGPLCPACGTRTEEIAWCREYLDRVIRSGSAAALEECVGVLEELLQRHSIAWN